MNSFIAYRSAAPLFILDRSNRIMEIRRLLTITTEEDVKATGRLAVSYINNARFSCESCANPVYVSLKEWKEKSKIKCDRCVSEVVICQSTNLGLIKTCQHYLLLPFYLKMTEDGW